MSNEIPEKFFLSVRKIKDDASVLFRSKKLFEARKKYLLVRLMLSEYVNASEYILGDQKRVKLEFMVVNSNLCLVQLMLRNFEEGVEAAKLGLEVFEKSFKGCCEGKPFEIAKKLYFRRCKCYFETKNFNSAIKDINICLESQSDNPLFKSTKRKIVKEMKKQKEELKIEKGMKWFGGGYSKSRAKFLKSQKIAEEKRDEEKLLRKKRIEAEIRLKIEKERQFFLENQLIQNEPLPDFSSLPLDAIVNILSFYRISFGELRTKFAPKMTSFFGYFRIDEDRHPFCIFTNFEFTQFGKGSMQFIPITKCRGISFNKSFPSFDFSRKVLPCLCGIHSLEYVGVDQNILKKLKPKNFMSLRSLLISDVEGCVDDEFIEVVNTFKYLRHFSITSPDGVDVKVTNSVKLRLPFLVDISIREKKSLVLVSFKGQKNSYKENWTLDMLNKAPSIGKLFSDAMSQNLHFLTFAGDLSVTTIQTLITLHLQEIHIGKLSNVTDQWLRLLLIDTLEMICFDGLNDYYEEERTQTGKDRWKSFITNNLNLSKVKKIVLQDCSITKFEMCLISQIPTLEEFVIAGDTITTGHIQQLVSPDIEMVDERKLLCENFEKEKELRVVLKDMTIVGEEVVHDDVLKRNIERLCGEVKKNTRFRLIFED